MFTINIYIISSIELKYKLKWKIMKISLVFIILKYLLCTSDSIKNIYFIYYFENFIYNKATLILTNKIMPIYDLLILNISSILTLHFAICSYFLNLVLSL